MLVLQHLVLRPYQIIKERRNEEGEGKKEGMKKE
jgi:hypothetical protein